MEIHQLVHAAAPGDAVTNSALEWRSLLRQVGPSEIFATHVDPRLAGDVRPLGAYYELESARTGRNLLLYHLSIGASEVSAFLRGRPERLGIAYHNVTPASYFEQTEPEFAVHLRRGRADLLELRDRTDFAFAVSPYNMRELEEAGYSHVRHVPLVVDVHRLRGVVPDESAVAGLEIDGPMLLFVGQVLPHKRPDMLLSLYHVLSTYQIPEASLVVAGAGRVPSYQLAITRYAKELNLYRSALLGWVSDAQLAALYRRASVFVTCSEHEGFCVPLLEAMAWDVPIVARDFAAIPETLGPAGLIVPQDSGPVLMAEAVGSVLGDERLRRSLVDAGRARLEAYDPDEARRTFLAALTEVA
jgi:glycosyltransferase involved in cell wall biosynthesis